MCIFRSVSLRAFENAFNGIWLVGESCITIHTTITCINVCHSINPRRCKIDKRWGLTAVYTNTHMHVFKLDNF